jgi:hypothetical protein
MPRLGAALVGVRPFFVVSSHSAAIERSRHPSLMTYLTKG